MTPPRQIHRGQLCFVTVRAVNRSYRFVPKRTVREVIAYCLAVTLDKYRGRIAMHEYLWMSNHFHLVLTDRGACLPRFMEELDSLLSRSLNALRGMTGTNIEKGYNLVAVTGESKLIEHCVYTLANPCSAHLVVRARHWKGVSSLKLEYGVPLVVCRPGCGLWTRLVARPRGDASLDAADAASRKCRGRSKLPDTVALMIERPAVMEHLSDVELRLYIRERLDLRERELIQERRCQGRRVLGWKEVVAKDFLDMPRKPEERCRLAPSYSADTREALADAAEHRRCFLDAYYEALRSFVLGNREVEFPSGTWLMKSRFGVTCCPATVT